MTKITRKNKIKNKNLNEKEQDPRKQYGNVNESPPLLENFLYYLFQKIRSKIIFKTFLTIIFSIFFILFHFYIKLDLTL